MSAKRSLDDYEDVVPAGTLRLVRLLARDLAGRAFLHVNSTRAGGGVAEILNGMLPLLDELGIRTRWEVISGTPEFYVATKRIHNTLQGADLPFTPAMKEIVIETARRAARDLDLESDLVMIHDPQPAALVEARHANDKWIWRCHIDLSRPQRGTWAFLEPFIRRYDGAVFHIAPFARRLPIPCYLVHPSIDPLTDKNREMEQGEIARRVTALGVPLDRPILLQVSRFDPFKDPVGVIHAFRLVRKVRDCVLVLAGGGASDDPEGAAVLTHVREEAAGDPDIHILHLPPDAHLDINALQRAATIVIQKSTREGFGLTVAEAMWKGKPVVGGATGGIVEQIQNGVNGFLVHTIDGCAFALRRLLADEELRHGIGARAREYARRNLLITRHMADYLQMLRLHTS
ncbi:MAG: glycosyltransferase [Vicinamibacteria bacterium]|nr:glycosyltransferase [Vicinamibacteria bacterium]